MLVDNSTPAQREALHRAEAYVGGHDVSVVPRFFPDGGTGLEVRAADYVSAFRAVDDLAAELSLPPAFAYEDGKYGAAGRNVVVWTWAR